MRLLTGVHDALRPAFGLERTTRLVFVTSIEGNEAGAGYDDETGTYVLVAVAALAHDDPAIVIGGVAHELRHAYQHEARDSLVSDPRADIWREARTHYDPEGPGYEYGPLETDAERAEIEVRRGYLGLPAPPNAAA